MKKVMLIWVLLLCIPVVFAGLKTDYEICQGTREIVENCSMLSPYLQCSAYTFEVLNMSGGVEQNGNLAIFNGSVYYFNLTVPEGDYLVRLCDNSTREIRVIEEDDGMIPIIIIIIPLVMAVLFAYWAFNVSKEHVALQYLFFLMSGISCFISMRFAMLSLIRFYNWFDMESALGETYTILMIIFGLIIFYFCFYLFRNIILKLQEKKDEEAEL